MKINIRKILAVASIAAVICASGCSGESAPETTTAPAETTTEAIVTEVATEAATEAASKATIDYSKEDRVVEVPYDGGYTAIFAFNANNDILRSENIPWGAGDTYYTYDSEGKLIETETHNDSDFVEKNVYHYDENGNLARLDVYEDKLLTDYYIFKYDNNGNKIYEALYHGNNGEIQYESTFKYDNEGKLIEDEDDSIAREYDADGNLMKETVDGITTEYVYENGLLMKEIRDGETKVEYAYFDNNNIVRVYWYESEDSIGEIDIGLYSDIFENR